MTECSSHASPSSKYCLSRHAFCMEKSNQHPLLLFLTEENHDQKIVTREILTSVDLL